MLWRILLALSVALNLFFLIKPKPVDLMGEFLRGLRGGEKCHEGVCHEGETLAYVLKRLQSPAPLTEKDIAHQPDELLMWGFALSAGEPKPYLALPLSPFERAYFEDGLGFGYALFRGVAKAKEICAESQPCHWGIGRALYFLNLDDAQIPEHAGKLFARVQMRGDEIPDAELRTPEDQLAAEVAGAIRSQKDLKNKCLLEKHMVACARP